MVKRALEGLDGVRKAEVSFSEKRAVVNYAPGAVTVEEMIEAVNKLGFRAQVRGEMNERSETEKSGGSEEQKDGRGF